MSRLTWGAPTERLFETGVDRGVLYVGVAAGVPWNGLVSVSESPTGGEAKPAYLDGVKFRNIASSEEFEATVEAFAAPKEFGPCDGSVSVQKGLFATQQPRRSFSMTYRTKVGNAVEGQDFGYKIHLVYNALAAPAQRNNATLSDSQGLTALSWALTTLPPSLTGFKPTAHFVIDSLTTPRLLLAAIEDILYGTDANAPRMPLVSELVTLFQSMGPVVARNSLLNPSWRKTTGTAEVRRNLFRNPTCSVNTTDWTNAANGQGTTTGTREVAGGLAGVFSTFYRQTWNTITGGAVASTGVIFGSPTTDNVIGPLVPGSPFSLSAYVRSSHVGRLAQLVVTLHDSAGVQNALLLTSAPVDISGGWTRLSVSTQSVPAGVTRAYARAYATGGTIWAVNDTFDVGGVLANIAGVVLPYLDGDKAASGGLTYSWVGAAGASASKAVGPAWAKSPFAAYSGTPGAVSWQSTPATARLLLKTTVAAGGIIAFQSPSGVDAVPGQYWAGRLRARQAVSMGPVNLRVTVSAYTNLLNHNGFLTEQIVGLPEDGSWVDIELPSNAITPASTVYVNWLIYASTAITGGTELEFEKAMDQLVADTGIMPDPYIDGAVPDADWYYYEWEGVADDSTSVLRSWN